MTTSTVGEDSPTPLLGPARLTTGRPLAEDPDTSMVDSVRLHLISEHTVIDALTLDPADAAALHTELHMTEQFEHPLTDLRFRPGRILALFTVGDALQADDVDDDPDDDPVQEPEIDPADPLAVDAPDAPDASLKGATFQPDPQGAASERHWIFEDEGTEDSLVEDLDDTPVNVPKMPVIPQQPGDYDGRMQVSDIPRAYRFASAAEPEVRSRNPILALWAR